MVQPLHEPLLVMLVVLVLLQMEICLPQLQLIRLYGQHWQNKKTYRNQKVAIPQHGFFMQ